MRIAFSGLSIIPGVINAGHVYARELVQALVGLDGEHEFLILVTRHNRHLFETGSPRVRQVEFPISTANRVLRILWEQSIIPMWLRRHRADVFHSPSNVLPVGLPCAGVVTIHFTNFLTDPMAIPWHKRWYYRSQIVRSARQASCVVTVSNFLKDRIVQHFGIAPGKIIVSYLGVNPIFHRDRANRPAIKSDDQSPYVMAVANVLPHKNVEGLIRAFDRLRTEHDLPHYLMLVGDPKMKETLAEVLESCPCARKNIIYTGFVDNHTLSRLYHGADLFVLPSFEESFGMPLLEAMAVGVPIACSNAGALPEIVGDAAVLFDPSDVDQMAGAMWAVLSDPLRQNDLIEKGKTRVRAFSWKNVALETIKAYEQAVQQG